MLDDVRNWLIEICIAPVSPGIGESIATSACGLAGFGVRLLGPSIPSLEEASDPRRNRAARRADRLHVRPLKNRRPIRPGFAITFGKKPPTHSLKSSSTRRRVPWSPRYKFLYVFGSTARIGAESGGASVSYRSSAGTRKASGRETERTNGRRASTSLAEVQQDADTSLQQQIAAKYLASLSANKALEEEKSNGYAR